MTWLMNRVRKIDDNNYEENYTQDIFNNRLEYDSAKYSLSYHKEPAHKQMQRDFKIKQFEDEEHKRRMKEFVEEKELRASMNANYYAAGKAKLRGDHFEEKGCLAAAHYYEKALKHTTQFNEEECQKRNRGFHDSIFDKQY